MAVTDPKVQSISAADDDSVFAVTLDGTVLQLSQTAQEWLKLEQNLAVAALAVSGGGELVFGISKGAAMVSPLNPLYFGPVEAGQPTATLVQIAGGRVDREACDVWAVDVTGALWASRGKWAMVSAPVGVRLLAATDDGHVYIVAVDKLYVSADGRTWTDFPTPEPLVAIAAAPNHLVAVGSSRKVYERIGDGWHIADGPAGPATDISVSAGGAVMAVAAGAIYSTHTGSWQWTKLPWPGTVPPAQVAIAHPRLAYALDAEGQGYRYTGIWDWRQIPGTLPPFARVAARDKSHLWILDGNGSVYTLTRKPGGFQSQQFGAKMHSIGASGDGAVWATDASGTACRWDGQFTPATTAPTLRTISVGSNTDMAALDFNGTPYRFQPGPAWQPVTAGMPATGFIDIAIDSIGRMRAVDRANQLWVLTSEWTKTDVGGLTQIAASVHVGGVWGVTTDQHPLPVRNW